MTSDHELNKVEVVSAPSQRECECDCLKNCELLVLQKKSISRQPILLLCGFAVAPLASLSALNLSPMCVP